MKRSVRYSAFALLLLTTLLLPGRGFSQCTCSEGEAPTPIEHVFVLDTTAASATTVSFPKFDPSIGTLTCITLHDTITIVSTLGIRNLDPSQKVYRFRLTVNTNVAGPGLSRDNLVDVLYGPDTLGASGSPTDSIVYGPDTVFENVPSLSNISDVTGYMGPGNVDLVYEIGGGVTSLAGGINFNSSVRTRTWGAFKLTYYWCPALILSSNIRNFSALKANSRVDLSWRVENEEASNTYELQVSHNGRVFTPVTRLAAGTIANGAADYHYQYLPAQAAGGKLYFRIKQVSADGKVTYSVVRYVYAGNENASDRNPITVYPNPLKGGQVSVQFGQPLTGNYKVEVVNMAGQVIYRNLFRMKNSNSLLFEMPGTPAGIYHLRATNTTGNQTYTSKLMVQH